MTNKGTPLISIGMPVRNCEPTLHLALNSLLLQSYSNWELLLIDDGSSDKTLQVARQFGDPRIKMYSDGQAMGLPTRLNQAIEMSRGNYFARMDGDDLAYPKRLERQVSYLETNPEIDVVGAWVIVFGPHGIALGKRAGPEKHADICRRPFAGFPMAHPTYMGRLKWFRRYGYRSQAKRCEDQDLLLRSYRFSRFANVPEILMGYREQHISLRKVLLGRFFFLQSIFQESRRKQQPDFALRGITEQIIKSVIDCIAVGSRLRYRILKHRALPLKNQDLLHWQAVWRSLNLWTTL